MTSNGIWLRSCTAGARKWRRGRICRLGSAPMSTVASAVAG